MNYLYSLYYSLSIFILENYMTATHAFINIFTNIGNIYEILNILQGYL
jgi:hypothetical protein